MKSIKVALLFMFFTQISFGQEVVNTTLSCKKYHVGEFQLTGKKSHIIITRTKTIQTETNTKTGDEYKYNIVWISDCKFQLTPVSENKKDQEFFKGKVFTGEIISSKYNTYICRSGFLGDKTTVTDEIRKIR